MQKEGNQLLTIYGCRKSRSGTRLNLTLVRNEGVGGKEYFTACIKLDNSGKVKVKESKNKKGEDVYLLSVPVLTDKKPNVKTDEQFDAEFEEGLKKSEAKKPSVKKSKDDSDDMPF
jgi:hypothetical protein